MTRLLTLIGAFFFIAGCAMAPVDRSLKPEQAGLLKDAKVYIVIPQDEIMGTVVESTVGRQFGLIGAILDEYENSKMHRADEDRLAPLRQATTDLDYRNDYVQSLKASGVFNSGKVELIAKAPMNATEREALIDSAKGATLVLVEVRYRLDNSYRVLVMSSYVSLWTRSQDGPVHSFTANYYSAPVTLDQSWGRLRALPQWMADGANSYRVAYREGIDQTIGMIRTAFVDRPNNVPMPNEPIYEFIDYANEHTGTVLHKKEGKLLRQDSNRCTGRAGRFLFGLHWPHF